MKKLLLLLFLLPLMALSSCHDDNDFPDCTLTVTMQNAVQGSDGAVYTVAGTADFGIASIMASTTTKDNVGLSGVIYTLDSGLRYANIISPYTLLFSADDMPGVGPHFIIADFNILQVGRPIFNSTVSVPFRVVEALKDVPGYEEGVTELGEVKLVYTIKKDS